MVGGEFFLVALFLEISPQTFLFPLHLSLFLLFLHPCQAEVTLVLIAALFTVLFTKHGSNLNVHPWVNG